MKRDLQGFMFFAAMAALGMVSAAAWAETVIFDTVDSSGDHIDGQVQADGAFGWTASPYTHAAMPASGRAARGHYDGTTIDTNTGV